MPSYTDRWGLSILGPNDTLAADGYKFSDADRRLLDRLLYYAAELHHHTGISGSDTTPAVAPGLTLLPTAGAMPSASRYYYRYTLIDDLGNETAPSPIAAIDSLAALDAPGAPALNYVSGSGSLEPGTYSYVLSAYANATTLETKALNSAVITVPGTQASNEVNLILPALPIGATGLNIYRKSPSGMHYLWITNVASPTNGQVWTDDGSIDGDCDRSLPATNRTSNTSAVRINYPGATPILPTGWTWRIYRSNSALDWSRSYLVDISPQGGGGATPVDYVDVGAGTQIGGPPTNAQVINAPSKIVLTDASEVTGTLPPGRAVVPQIVTLTEPGTVTAGAATFTWICDYDQADILSVRAYLGVNSVPASTDVIVDVNALRPAVSGSWISIFDDGPNRPTIPVGETASDASTPTHQHLVAGDAVTFDVDQAGGGATPTDHDLTVSLLLYVKSGSETTSYTWATT